MANNNGPSSLPTLQEELSGKEIQPYRRLISPDQIQQISQHLKEQILKSIDDLKVMRNEGTSESHQAQLVVPLSSVSAEETPKKRGKKRTTQVIRQFSLSFEVPHICMENNIDLDNSILYDESVSNANKCHQFSFTERLKNWTLEQRERNNGMCDVYYNHMISGNSFRSKKEVLNFLIYEKYPSKQSNKKEKQLEVLEASAATNNNESLGKGKEKCYEEMDKFAADRERVVKFLAESYENLMNYDFGDQ